MDYEPFYITLKGNTSLMTSEVGNAPAKLIQEFRKKNDRPILKGAFIDEVKNTAARIMMSSPSTTASFVIIGSIWGQDTICKYIS